MYQLGDEKKTNVNRHISAAFIRLRRSVASLVAGILLALTISAQEVEQKFRQEITRAQQAQLAGDFEGAEDALLFALRLAENQTSPNLAAEAAFPLGYLYEQWGQTSPERKEEFLRGALVNYQRAAQPSSSPMRLLALNNLGNLYVSYFSGSIPQAKEKAAQIFKELVQTVPPEDPNRAIYTVNYGYVLEAIDRPDDAKDTYYQAVADAPGFARPVRALFRLLLHSRPISLNEHASLIQKLNKQGNYTLAREGLRMGLARSAEEENHTGFDALLRSLVQFYARFLIGPRKFFEEEEPFLSSLASQDDYVLTPVNELSRLYSAKFPKYVNHEQVIQVFPYWGKEGYREDLGELTTMLGDSFKLNKELEQATPFYSLSIASNPKRAEAAISLASLFLQKPDIDPDELYLKALLRVSESESVRESWMTEDLLRIHTILGSLLSEKSRWDGALSHFEAAIKYDRLLRETSSSAPRSPGMYEMAAKAYRLVGDVKLAQQLLLNAAEDYMHNGDVEGALRSLQMITEIDLPLADDDQHRMDALRLWIDLQKAYQPPFCEFEIIESTCTGENSLRTGGITCQHCCEEDRCPDNEIVMNPWDIPSNVIVADPARDRKCSIRLLPTTKGACVPKCRSGRFLIPVGTKR